MTRKENQTVVFANQNRNLQPVDLPTHTVANLPDPAINEGRIIYVTDGVGGSPVLAFSDGTEWLSWDNRAEVYDPIILFSSGEEGVLFDKLNPADGFLFQNNNATVPCTQGGQTVAVMFDRSQGSRGPELWVGTPDVIEDGWTDNGDGTFTSDGTQTGNSELKFLNVIPDIDNFYDTEFKVDSISAGFVRVIASVDAGAQRGEVGFFTENLRSEAAGGNIEIRANVDFVGTVSLVSFKKILGNHALQSTSGFRPTIERDGNGNWYLDFDGVDNFLQTANGIDFTQTDKLTVMAALRKLEPNTANVVLEFGGANDMGGFTHYAPHSGTNRFAASSRGDAGASAGQLAVVTDPAFDAPITVVETALHDIAASTTRIRINAVQLDVATGNKGAGTFGDKTLFLGIRNSDTFPFEGRVYGILVIDRLLTATELADTETYFGNLAGLSI